MTNGRRTMTCRICTSNLIRRLFRSQTWLCCGYSTCRATTSILLPPRDYSILAVSAHHDFPAKQGFNYQFLLHSHPSQFVHTTHFLASVESLPPQLQDPQKADASRGSSQLSAVNSLLPVTELRTASLRNFWCLLSSTTEASSFGHWWAHRSWMATSPHRCINSYRLSDQTRLTGI